MIVVKSTKTVPYVYEPYPRCKYGPDGASVVVQDAAERSRRTARMMPGTHLARRPEW